MHLCTCVSRKGGDGEGVDLQVIFLMSFTLSYVSLVGLVTLCGPRHLCGCVIEECTWGELWSTWYTTVRLL
jgi:hypothetical protein